MKKALKKLSAAVLAMAMIASLTPVTGGLVLADETDVPETTSSTETELQKKRKVLRQRLRKRLKFLRPKPPRKPR